MKVANQVPISSAISSEELESSLEWLKTMVGTFENRDQDFAEKYFEEGGTFYLSGEGAVTGMEDLTKYFRWLHSPIKEWLFECKSAHFISDRIIYVVEGWASFAKGPKQPFSWVMIAEKDPGSTKHKNAWCYGEIHPLFVRVTNEVGPIQGLTTKASSTT